MKLGSLEMIDAVAKPIASAAETFDYLNEVMVCSPHRNFCFFEENEGPATLYLTERLYFEGSIRQPLPRPTPFEQIIRHSKKINSCDDWGWLEYIDLLAAVDRQLETSYLGNNALAHVVSFRVFRVLRADLGPLDGMSVALVA